MTIEAICNNCGRATKVEDDLAGRQARCPICNNIYTVPASSTTADTSPAPLPLASSADDPKWYLRTPEGVTYGPASQQEVDQWVMEGRVTSDCQLRQGEAGVWQPADRAYPALANVDTAPPRATAPSPQRPPAINTASTYQHATAASPYANASVIRQQAAHRGGLILVLGILGWMVCPIFSMFAWSMGATDLRRMRAGRMDRSGYSLTQAGYVLGFLLCAIWGVMLLGGLLISALGIFGAIAAS